MVSKFAILSNLLLVSLALAAPSSRLDARLVRRRENRQSRLIDRVESADDGVSHVSYSKNWAGAVWNKDAVCAIPVIQDRPQSDSSLIGNFHLYQCYLPSPHPFGKRRCCNWLGWYRW